MKVRELSNEKAFKMAVDDSCLILLLFLVKPIYRRTLNISIICNNTNQRTYYDGENYYYLQADGIYLNSDEDKKLISVFDCIQFLVKENNIYCLTVESNVCQMRIFDITSLQEIDTIYFSESEGRVYLLGITDKTLIYCYYDKDIKKINIVSYDILSKVKKNDLSKNFFDTSEILYYTDDDLFLASYNSGSIFSQQSINKIGFNYKVSSEIFGFVGSTKLLYTDNVNLSNIYIYDFLTDELVKSNISDNSKISNCKIQLSYIDKSIDTFALIGNSASPFIFEGGDFNFSNQLKYHNHDVLTIFDSGNGNIMQEKSFKTFERILYIDNEKVITYRNGKYLFYDLDNWDLIRKLSADEIKNGGFYTFEICGDYIFVFDDNSGELLNKISVID